MYSPKWKEKAEHLFHRFRKKFGIQLCTFFIIISLTFVNQFICTLIAGFICRFFLKHISLAFFNVFFYRASEGRDSLSDILRGVFKFTSSRQRYRADGYYQFPHLFSVRLQIFLSLHLELGSGAAIFLS